MLGLNGFFKYSIYIGHSVYNSLVLSSWFFYKLRKKIWIINLFKTIIYLKLVFKFLKYLTNSNLPFWFVSVDLSKEFLFKKYALECGEFACTKVWIRGFLSNFKSIQNSIGKYIYKKHIFKTNKKKYLIDMWSLTRFTWPRGIFLSDIISNYVICKEAGSMLLPVVALVDTNVKSYLFNYPIPSNDDAINSINYIISIISKKILLYKYKKVVIWYNTYKAKSNKIFNCLHIFNSNFKKKLNRIKKKSVLKKYKYLTKKGYIKNLLKNKFKRFFFIKCIYNKNFKKKLFFNFFSKYKHFIQIGNLLMQNLFLILPKRKYLPVTSILASKIYLLHSKLHFLNKIRILKNRNKYLLKTNFLKLNQKPFHLYERTIKLKYLNKKHSRSKKVKKNLYLYYYLISNYLRKNRVFHETFFINKPSPFIYVRAFHQLNPFYYNNKNKYDNSQFKDKRDYWHSWNNYKYKVNYRAMDKFYNSRFNKMLIKNWKYNKKLAISDSAILFNLERWVTYSRKAKLVDRSSRHNLTYWLYPFFRRFSVKEGFRWYNSKFFHKEDTKFKYHFNWNLPKKIKTPLTTFHFYNNWFSFLFKYKHFFKRYKKIYADSRVKHIKRLKLKPYKKPKNKNIKMIW